MRLRMLVSTFHPDAGGSRRQGEVFDLTDAVLAEHWVTQRLATDASGQEIYRPSVVPAVVEEERWEITPLGDDPAAGVVLNSDDRPSVMRAVGLRKQRRE